MTTSHVFSLRGMGIVFALLLVAFTDMAFASKGKKSKVTKTKSSCAAPTPISMGVPNPPVKYGMILFQAFEMLDVFGPIEALNILSRSVHLELSLISSANDTSLVTSEPVNPAMNPMNSTMWPSMAPTHSILDAPTDLDVLIIPGGLGTLSPYLASTIEYIREVFPNLQYLITVCRGASLAAQAGVLDNRRATTNKAGWSRVVTHGTNVTWVEQARWVVDGNVWTSSGISAGIDATVAFIDAIYGHANATDVANLMEYEPNTDPSWDPFAAIYGLGTSG